MQYLGSHIRTPGVVYDHHMLVIRVIDPYYKRVLVIHYNATHGNLKRAKLGRDVQIIEEEITIEEKIEIAVYKDSVKVFKPAKAIERARSRLDEEEYKLFSNNCESFVNWALAGEDITDQGKAAPVKIVAGAAIGVGVAGAIVAGLYGLSKLLSEDNKESESDSEDS